MRYDYAETKDLCKQFLTLVSGVLVFSLAFAEKIADFQKSPKFTRYVLLASWTLLVASIASCGIALVYLALAGGQAVYGAGDYYLQLAARCYTFVIAAGAFFVVGLVALVLAGAVATLSRVSGPKAVGRQMDSRD